VFHATQMCNTHEACTGNLACLQNAPKKNLENEAKTDFVDHPDDPSRGEPGVTTKPVHRPSGRARQWEGVKG
jgi:hypothetical protein